MPIIKANVLGSNIDINYEAEDREKLNILISNFTKRLDEFSNNGRIGNSKIILMAALKAEDEIFELKKLIDENIKNKKEIIKQKIILEKLNNEIIILKDELNKLNLNYLSEKKNNNLIEHEIDDLKNINIKIQNKINDSKNDK